MLDRPAPILPLTVEARKKIEDAIELLMARLDEDDARFEDLEPDDHHGGDVNDEPQGDPDCANWCADNEPSHGATTAMNHDHAWRATSDSFWGSGEGEPSLGWAGIGRGHPQAAVRGYDTDREMESRDEFS